MRLLLVLPAAFAALACDEPRCQLPRVTPPATDATMGWLEPARPRVPAVLGTLQISALLDTAFPRSAVSTRAISEAGGINPERVRFALGGATAGVTHWELTVSLPTGLDVLAGADVLSQLPLVFDARARTTRVRPGFTPGDGAAPLERWTSGDLCRFDSEQSGPASPEFFLVTAELDGVPLTFAVDTGADITLVRRSAIPDLATRPSFYGLPVQTQFAGAFAASVTRARTLTVGGRTSPGAPLVFGGRVDEGLDLLLSEYPHGAPPRLDGLLGWSFLREFEVSLALGDDATTGRALGLTRFDTQAHWKRDFVGIGVATTENASPQGLLVNSLYSGAPAISAGLQSGDVILSVNDLPALFRPHALGPAGRDGAAGLLARRRHLHHAGRDRGPAARPLNPAEGQPSVAPNSPRTTAAMASGVPSRSS